MCFKPDDSVILHVIVQTSFTFGHSLYCGWQQTGTVHYSLTTSVRSLKKGSAYKTTMSHVVSGLQWYCKPGPTNTSLDRYWGWLGLACETRAIVLASSPGYSQILSRKWWTRLVQTKSTISSPWHSFDPSPSPDFSSQLRDKIWEWPGDEATIVLHPLQSSISFWGKVKL